MKKRIIVIGIIALIVMIVLDEGRPRTTLGVMNTEQIEFYDDNVDSSEDYSLTKENANNIDSDCRTEEYVGSFKTICYLEEYDYEINYTFFENGTKYCVSSTKCLYDGSYDCIMQFCKNLGWVEVKERCVPYWTKDLYCTTEEHDRLLTTRPSVCGFIEDTDDRHDGLIKIKGVWINKQWIEKIC